MLPRQIYALCRDEAGATLIEYGIAIVLAVIVGTAGLLGLATQIDGNLDAASTQMDVLE